MNRGGFSWKRLLGISALKSKIARLTGIPFTQSGRQRKLGAVVETVLMQGALYVQKWLSSLMQTIKHFFNT